MDLIPGLLFTWALIRMPSAAIVGAFTALAPRGYALGEA